MARHAIPASPSTDDVAPRRYTVDEFAAAVGLPTRTVRFYQAQHVLPKPLRRGRLALYDARHVERVEIIRRMQARGLSLRAVRHVLHDGSHDARDLEARLGLRDSLEKPWSDDAPRTVSDDELYELLGTRAADVVDSLLAYDVIRRDAASPTPAYRIPSPGLLRVTLALRQSDVDVDTAAGAGAILLRRLGQAADELVEHFARRAGRGFGRSRKPEALTAALDALRPLAGEAARIVFARQIERALRHWRDSTGARRSRRGRHGRR